MSSNISLFDNKSLNIPTRHFLSLRLNKVILVYIDAAADSHNNYITDSNNHALMSDIILFGLDPAKDRWILLSLLKQKCLWSSHHKGISREVSLSQNLWVIGQWSRNPSVNILPIEWYLRVEKTWRGEKWIFK